MPPLHCTLVTAARHPVLCPVALSSVPYQVYQSEAVREMIIYGMCYKRGHVRKNWQIRLLVLDGDTLSYYELGNPLAKNTFSLAQVTSAEVTKVQSKVSRQPPSTHRTVHSTVHSVPVASLSLCAAQLHQQLVHHTASGSSGSPTQTRRPDE